MDDDSNDRLERLLSHLAGDEANIALLSDAAETALAARKPDLARELLQRHAKIAPLGDRQVNLAGLAALQTGAYADAAEQFSRLLGAHPDDASLRFNYAWALAMLKRFDDALAFLDTATTEALPQAAMLEVQLLHELGHFDKATEHGKHHIRRHPTHTGLLAAMSVLAIDIEDPALAEACARGAGDHPDALITLGSLALNDGRDSEAAALFERALQWSSDAPRGWIGKGLVDMTVGRFPEAAHHLERGAQIFDTHVGSWIAAGWAYLLGQNLTEARRCFGRALELDRNFSESHGSLAVLALFEGRMSDAQRLSDAALRLDRNSAAGALSRALLLEAQGKPDLARKIIEHALHAPIEPGGATLAQAIAKRALFA